MMQKPIEMICRHDEMGQIRPLRFRMSDEMGELVTIRVDGIVSKKEEKVASKHFMAGPNCLVYFCRCVINDLVRTLELQFRKDECKWFISKRQIT